MPMLRLPATFETDQRYPVDLHMHSTASDGALTPTQLVTLCAERGLTHMALTDHDTMDGVVEAGQAAASTGMCLLPGCELSTRWQGINIHMVALMPGGLQGPLVEGLIHQREARIKRAEVIAERLEKAGLTDALAKAREQAGSDRPLGRPDFARALVADGMVADWASAFKRFLGSGKKGDVKAHWPEISDAVGWVVASGGVAVLAHPLRHGLTRRKRGLLMDTFQAAGGQAVELVSGQQNPDSTRDLARQLVERELYASMGSDFHFPGSHAAPGSMSMIPRTAAPPIWQHPRLRHLQDAPAGPLAAA
ncbi:MULTISPECIES: PHP domain-containing protein [Halomonadaceae]|uniref:PHP domain-containing protein n=1 Tax=Vreelandella janggokensis TaxID=370767 RepID=A0ABT4IQT5_9GAMM|nr:MULTISPECIES: PHP domain-containing protein [Halomonas]MCW4149954.1 PHP domain-containing protein [Halomonas sp. 18H]MCZ0926042.1 PHP domain-containing protein [Halomonas janggokensis]MCZ0931109.1 PHP domain-containing protein [Halomonas janggokensis]MDR5886545.1 PHP domain-containing protein [Halomonas janggokensis]